MPLDAPPFAGESQQPVSGDPVGNREFFAEFLFASISAARSSVTLRPSSSGNSSKVPSYSAISPSSSVLPASIFALSAKKRG